MNQQLAQATSVHVAPALTQLMHKISALKSEINEANERRRLLWQQIEAAEANGEATSCLDSQLASLNEQLLGSIKRAQELTKQETLLSTVH